MHLYEAFDEIRSAGFVRKRLRGGHQLTPAGRAYLRDAILRNEELRAKMAKQIDRWESGAMTKAERQEAIVELVVLGWIDDHTAEKEAFASLRAQGFNPLSPEARATMREKFGFDPFEYIKE